LYHALIYAALASSAGLASSGESPQRLASGRAKALGSVRVLGREAGERGSVAMSLDGVLIPMKGVEKDRDLECRRPRESQGPREDAVNLRARPVRYYHGRPHRGLRMQPPAGSRWLTPHRRVAPNVVHSCPVLAGLTGEQPAIAVPNRPLVPTLPCHLRDVQTPGLMLGLAGIGLGLLRLWSPARIPAVNWLAGPPARSAMRSSSPAEAQGC
jgi:hypothetical protein